MNVTESLKLCRSASHFMLEKALNCNSDWVPAEYFILKAGIRCLVLQSVDPSSLAWGDRQTTPNSRSAVFLSAETGYRGDGLKREIICFSANLSRTCLLMLHRSCTTEGQFVLETKTFSDHLSLRTSSDCFISLLQTVKIEDLLSLSDSFLLSFSVTYFFMLEESLLDTFIHLQRSPEVQYVISC